MARVTVEDCVVEIPNRFELVVLAAERTKHISSGAPLTVERDNDKNPVVALREIANNKIEISNLRDSVVASLQKNNKMDDIAEENLYAETQESMSIEEGFDDIAKEASFSTEEEIGFEVDIDFSDDISEEH